jgi:pimeloyl-ACP methyl ester carboxylesterase
VPSFHATDGAELFYEERGARGSIPILFVHGWRGDATLWTPIVDALAESYRTIAIDVRGFGASNAAPGPYRVETFADDLSALVAALDLDPLVAVGHSMGAAVAQRFAIDRPDAVEGLVLVAPVPATALAYPPKLDAMFRATIGNDANTIAWLAKLTVSELSPATVRAMRNAAALATPAAALESYESWTSLTFGDDAATIDTPTLVLAADGDRPMTPDLVRERVADRIAGSRFVVLEETGHYAIVERPERIADEISDFIEEL